MAESISFKLNGEPVNLDTDGDRMLLWVLRTDLGLTGTKFGCGKAQCGACTVLVGNKAVQSCRFPVKEAQGKEVITIEGLAASVAGRKEAPSGNDTLHRIQEAFIEHDALQCGFCTPGMILKAYSLLAENPRPSRPEIIQGMEGNLCRCGAYLRIVQAIEAAARAGAPSDKGVEKR